VNLGGAVGDISWIDENVKPWVSFHVPDDPFAPYGTGVLTVPGTGDPADPNDDFAVVEVSGAGDIQTALNGLSINADFETMIDASIEDFDAVASERSGGVPGLFPMPNNAAADGSSSSAPWDFYSPDIPTIPPNDPPNPELARTYYDTIFAYTAPRACIALGLGCNMVSSVEEVQEAADFGVQVAPNPTTGAFIVQSNYENPMLDIQLFDLSGRMVQRIAGIQQSTVRVERNSLARGVYIAKIRFEEGIVTQKVAFE
ncbi:MAG: T9SS type A sorting domain-containing protein, partial [Bacteroidota bacterium]